MKDFLGRLCHEFYDIDEKGGGMTESNMNACGIRNALRIERENESPLENGKRRRTNGNRNR